MDSNTFLKAIWQGTDILRGEVEPAHFFDIHIISLTHLYIESNTDLSVMVREDQGWRQITSSGYGLKDRLRSSLLILENSFPFLKGVFNFVSIPDEVTDATLFRFVTNLNKYPLIPEKEFGTVLEKLLYLIAREEGRRGGEHSSPKAITDLLPELLDIKNGEVYDGASGQCQLLINSLHYGEQRGGIIKVYGQEKNGKAWAIGKLNLFLNGIIDAEMELGDTLTNPLILEQHSVKKFDCVVMNPPFALRKWGRDEVKGELYGRFIYGLPSDSNSDMAFLSHAIASLKDDGKAAIVLPHGVLFRGGTDGKIREELLRADLIEAVIGLPNSLLFNTSIPIVVLIINKSKPSERKSKVLFIDASNDFRGQRGQNFLEREHIEKIVQTYRSGKETPQYSNFASLEEIAEANWTLTIPRYITINEIKGEFGTVKADFNFIENPSLELKPLYEVSETFRGYNIPSVSKVADPKGDYFVIQLIDVQDGTLLKDQLQKVKIDDGARVKNYLVNEGDIIISNRGANIKIALIPKFEGNLLLTSNFHAIRPKTGISSSYLKAYLESPIAQAHIQSLQQGSMVKVIGVKELNNLMIPIQPLKVQREIGAGFEAADEEYQKSINEANEKRKEAYEKGYKTMGIDIVLS